MNATLARLTRLTADIARETDGRLLDAFLAGSQPAFRELVTRHGSLVFAVCNRVLHHRQDAEDAFQATFLVLARRAAEVWPRDAIGSWLYGVAHRVALKARTLRTRKTGREQPLEDVAQPVPQPLEPDLAELLHLAIRKLPEVYRAAVIACDLEGLSRMKAAEHLGWKEGTLSGRLARARKLLADRLRKGGLALPAGGLVVALGTTGPVRAALMESTVALAAGDPVATAPSLILSLTEGIVQSMAAFKLKLVATALMLVCTVGLGAWAAGGGEGNGGGAAQAQGAPAKVAPQPEPPNRVPPGPPLQLVRQETAVLLEALALAHEKQIKGKLDPETVEKLKARIQALEELLAMSVPAVNVPPAKDREKLNAELEFLRGKWHIVSIKEGKAVTNKETFRGDESEVRGNILFMPYRDTRGILKHDPFNLAVDTVAMPRTIDLIAPNKPVGRGIYELTAPAMTCTQCHQNPHPNLKPLNLKVAPDLLGLCGPGLKVRTGMRLAVGTAGKRPTKFDSGDEGVIEFTLERVPDAPDGGKPVAKAPADEVREARAKVLVAEHAEQLARVELQAAEVATAQAQAVVERATKQFTLASRSLQAAQAKLAEAEKELAKLSPKPAPAKDGESFTIHIRPLAAPEKVLSVKLTGNQTVLDALTDATKDATLQLDSFNVWVARGKEILPVDVEGILRHGVTKTNYQLKLGDHLFIQVKVGK